MKKILLILVLQFLCISVFAQNNIPNDDKIENDAKYTEDVNNDIKDIKDAEDTKKDDQDTKNIEIKTGNYFLKDGILKAHNRKDIRLDGEIVYFIETDNKIYYILKQKPKDKKDKDNFSAGAVFFENNENVQVVIPFDFNLEKMKKLLFTSQYCYLLMEHVSGDEKILYRINLTTNENATISSVIDIASHQDDIVIVERRAASVYVNFKDNRIPVTIKKNIEFKQILNDGIAIVSNNEYNEIIDFIRQKNVYSYYAVATPVLPDKYNLIIEIVDDVPNLTKGKEDDMLYYKIYLNGKEIGRTDTGISGLKFEYTLLCEPDKHHIVKIERWKLDKVNGEYKRENNIMQPEPVKLFVPFDRLMKIAVNYDGKKYIIKEFPVVE